jgi:hypothetical protein
MVLAELAVLQDLDGEPVEETATLKQVRQSGRYRVWRVAHPYHAEVAVRLIVWFPPGDPGTVVVALFAGDKVTVWVLFSTTVSVPGQMPRSVNGCFSSRRRSDERTVRAG